MDTPLDRLVMVDMLRIGLLKAKQHEVLVEHPSGLKMLLWSRDDPDSIKAAWIGSHGPVKGIIISVVWVEVGKLLRPYFVCSETGEHCRVISIHNGRFVCRAAPSVADVFAYWHKSLLGHEWLDKHRDRLLGEDGRGPSRGKKRQKLLALLSEHPD